MELKFKQANGDMNKVNADLEDQETIHLESLKSTKESILRDAKTFATKLEKYAKLPISTQLHHTLKIVECASSLHKARIEEMVNQLLIAMSKEEFQGKHQNQHHQQEIK